MTQNDYRDFVYCPYCGSTLDMREVFHQVRPTCSLCGYVQFRDPKVAVVAFIISGDDDRLLLIRRAVEPARGKWALPGGFMDAGEMPQDAVVREVWEEVGLRVSVRHLLDIFPMAGLKRAGRGIVLVYRADPVDGQCGELRVRDDVSDARWFRRDDVPEELAFESTAGLLTEWIRAAGSDRHAFPRSKHDRA
jgi:ADP-ribose pyrophosphatase YjhB (NUDIX family)